MQSNITQPYVRAIWGSVTDDGSEVMVFMRQKTRWLGWFHVIDRSQDEPNAYAHWADPTTETNAEKIFSDLDRVACSGVSLDSSEVVFSMRVDVRSQDPERVERVLALFEQYGFTRPTRIPP